MATTLKDLGSALAKAGVVVKKKIENTVQESKANAAAQSNPTSTATQTTTKQNAVTLKKRIIPSSKIQKTTIQNAVTLKKRIIPSSKIQKTTTQSTAALKSTTQSTAAQKSTTQSTATQKTTTPSSSWVSSIGRTYAQQEVELSKALRAYNKATTHAAGEPLTTDSSTIEALRKKMLDEQDNMRKVEAEKTRFDNAMSYSKLNLKGLADEFSRLNGLSNSTDANIETYNELIDSLTKQRDSLKTNPIAAIGPAYTLDDINQQREQKQALDEEIAKYTKLRDEAQEKLDYTKKNAEEALASMQDYIYGSGYLTKKYGTGDRNKTYQEIEKKLAETTDSAERAILEMDLAMLREGAEYDKYLYYDTAGSDALIKEITQKQEALEEEKINLLDQLNRLGEMVERGDTMSIAQIQTRRDQIDGEIAALQDQINGIRSDVASAKQVQKIDKFYKLTGAKDFDEYAKQGAAIENKPMSKLEENLTGIRPELYRSRWYAASDNPAKASREAEDPTAPIDRSYRYMTDDEYGIYNYLLAKEGKDKAEEFHLAILDMLNAREGQRIVEGIADLHPAVRAGADVGLGLASGVTGFWRNTGNFLNAWTGNDLDPATSLEQANAQNIERLGTVGPSLPGSKNTLAQDAVEAATVIGNMAPSIMMGQIAGGVAASLPAWAKGIVTRAGTAAMGVSAAGGYYEEAMQKGYSDKEAKIYSSLAGTAEAVLQDIIGGVTHLGGKIPEGISKNIISNIDNSFLRMGAEFGVRGFSEGIEEYLQDVLGPAFYNLASGEHNVVQVFNNPEATHSFLMALVTTGLLESGNVYNETISASKLGHTYHGLFNSQSELLRNAATWDGEIGELAQRMINGQTKINDANLGRIIQEYANRGEANKLAEGIQKAVVDAMPDEMKQIYAALQNPDAVVLNDDAKYIVDNTPGKNVEWGMQQQVLLTTLMSGRDLTNAGWKLLDVTNPAVQEVFASKTGAEFTEGMSRADAEQVFRSVQQRIAGKQLADQRAAATAKADATKSTDAIKNLWKTTTSREQQKIDSIMEQKGREILNQQEPTAVAAASSAPATTDTTGSAEGPEEAGPGYNTVESIEAEIKKLRQRAKVLSQFGTANGANRRVQDINLEIARLERQKAVLELDNDGVVYGEGAQGRAEIPESAPVAGGTPQPNQPATTTSSTPASRSTSEKRLASAQRKSLTESPAESEQEAPKRPEIRKKSRAEQKVDALMEERGRKALEEQRKAPAKKAEPKVENTEAEQKAKEKIPETAKRETTRTRTQRKVDNVMSQRVQKQEAPAKATTKAESGTPSWYKTEMGDLNDKVTYKNGTSYTRQQWIERGMAKYGSTAEEANESFNKKLASMAKPAESAKPAADLTPKANTDKVLPERHQRTVDVMNRDIQMVDGSDLRALEDYLVSVGAGDASHPMHAILDQATEELVIRENEFKEFSALADKFRQDQGSLSDDEARALYEYSVINNQFNDIFDDLEDDVANLRGFDTYVERVKREAGQRLSAVGRTESVRGGDSGRNNLGTTGSVGSDAGRPGVQEKGNSSEEVPRDTGGSRQVPEGNGNRAGRLVKLEPGEKILGGAYIPKGMSRADEATTRSAVGEKVYDAIKKTGLNVVGVEILCDKDGGVVPGFTTAGKNGLTIYVSLNHGGYTKSSSVFTAPGIALHEATHRWLGEAFGDDSGKKAKEFATKVLKDAGISANTANELLARYAKQYEEQYASIKARDEALFANMIWEEIFCDMIGSAPYSFVEKLDLYDKGIGIFAREVLESNKVIEQAMATVGVNQQRPRYSNASATNPLVSDSFYRDDIYGWADDMVGSRYKVEENDEPMAKFATTTELVLNDPKSKIQQVFSPKTGEAKADNLKAQLSKLVKPQEMQWTGLNYFFEEHKGQNVTKQQVLDFIKGNNIRVDQTGYHDAKADRSSYLNPVTGVVSNSLDEAIDDLILDLSYIGESYGLWNSDFTRDDMQLTYLADGSVTVTMNNWEDEPIDVVTFGHPKSNSTARWGGSDPQGQMGNYALSNGDNYREYTYKYSNRDSELPYTNTSMSLHFEDTDLLGHARMQDFDTPDGEKVLFVEEIQSDWASARRRGGKLEEDPEFEKLKLNTKKLYEEAAKLRDIAYGWEARKRGKNYVERMKELYFDKRDEAQEAELAEKKYLLSKHGLRLQYLENMPDETEEGDDLTRSGWAVVDVNDDYVQNVTMGPDGQPEPSGVMLRETEEEAVTDALRILNIREPAPDMPFGADYYKFILKDLLYKAANGEYDYIAWATPEMQSERYYGQKANSYQYQEYKYDFRTPEELKAAGEKRAQAGPIQSFLSTYTNANHWKGDMGLITLDGAGPDPGHNMRITPVPAMKLSPEMKETILYMDQPLYKAEDDVAYGNEPNYAPVFYDKLQRIVEEKFPAKLGANQVDGWLRGKGVKEEDIKWSGIRPFLEGKKSVTKQEVLEFLANTGLDIQQEILEGNRVRWDTYSTPFGTNHKEILWRMPDSDYTNPHMYAHWGSQGYGTPADHPKGVLVHARVNDREMVNPETGEAYNTLFVDEIQSDWHNAGREHGYMTDEVDENKRSVDEINESILALRKERDDKYKEMADEFFFKSPEGKKLLSYAEDKQELEDFIRNDLDAGYSEEMHFDNDPLQRVLSGLVGKDQNTYFAWIDFDTESARLYSEYNRRIAREMDEMLNMDNRAPDAPFRNTYTEFAMKNLLRMAAEGGYEAIGWTSAKQQVDRWSPAYEEMYRIEYDQDIPKFMRKYGKQWGTRVYRDTNASGLGLVDRGLYNTLSSHYHGRYSAQLALDNPELSDSEKNKYAQLLEFSEYNIDRLNSEAEKISPWVMPLTDELKNSVLYEGQPLFKAEDVSAAEAEGVNLDEAFPEGSFERTLLDMMRSGNTSLAEEYIQGLLESQRNPTYTAEPDPTFTPVTDHEIENIRASQNSLINRYGKLRPGEKAAREVNVAEKQNDKTFTRRHAAHVAEAAEVPEHTARALERFIATDEAASYVRITDKAATEYADNLIKKQGVEKTMKQWDGLASPMHNPTKYDIALGESLALWAAHNGRDDLACKIWADINVMATQAGQVVQAMRLVKKMAPEYQMYYLQKVADQLNKQYNGKATITINKDLEKNVLEAQTQEELDKAMDAMLDDLARQVPVTFKEKWDSWRYFAMLGNPRTHVRNIIGNAVFAPLVFGKNLMAAGLEKLIPVDNRTKSITGKGKYKEFANADFKEMKNIITGEGNKYTSPRNAILARRRIWKSKVMDKATSFVGDALNAEDAWFLKPYYTSALSGFLAARNADVEALQTTPEGHKLLNEARMYAVREAQKATYRDLSVVAQALNKMKRTPGLGLLLDGILPFTGTPVNILRRGIEYSPVGLLKTLTYNTVQLARGSINASQYIDNLSSGMTGTMVAALGFLLAKAGILRGGDDEDDKYESFIDNLGEQNFAIRFSLGGKDYSYTIDWAAPSSLPLFIGAAAYKLFANDEKLTAADMADALTLLADPMMQLSMLDGLNRTLGSLSYANTNEMVSTLVQEMGTSYFGQAIPTLFGQIARTMDGTRRSSYTDKNSNVPKWIQYFIQSSVQNKIPVWEGEKMAYIDLWGRRDTEPSIALRAIENFISPGYLNRITVTPVDEELDRLYHATGAAEILPRKGSKYFSVNSERKDLTAKEFERYCEESGQVKYALLNMLFSDKRYVDAPDSVKQSLVEDMYKYANASTKYHIDSNYNINGQGKWIANAESSENVYESIMDSRYAVHMKSSGGETVETATTPAAAPTNEPAAPTVNLPNILAPKNESAQTGSGNVGAFFGNIQQKAKENSAAQKSEDTNIGFSEHDYNHWKAYVQPAGISAKTFSDALRGSDTDGNQHVKQDEIGAYLNQQMRDQKLTIEQAEAIWKGAGPTWKTTYSGWFNKGDHATRSSLDYLDEVEAANEARGEDWYGTLEELPAPDPNAPVYKFSDFLPKSGSAATPQAFPGYEDSPTIAALAGISQAQADANAALDAAGMLPITWTEMLGINANAFPQNPDTAIWSSMTDIDTTNGWGPIQGQDLSEEARKKQTKKRQLAATSKKAKKSTRVGGETANPDMTFADYLQLLEG